MKSLAIWQGIFVFVGVGGKILRYFHKCLCLVKGSG